MSPRPKWLILLAATPALSAAENHTFLDVVGGLASNTVGGAVGGATFVADTAFVGAAKNLGLNNGDISVVKNLTTHASYDALACSGDIGCVYCYGIASAGVIAMSTATTATCGMFAIACPFAFAYGVYTTSQDAVKVYHEGIDGVDPCKIARHDARLRSDADASTNNNPDPVQSRPNADSAGPAPMMRRLEPQTVSRGTWSNTSLKSPDALAVVHLGGLLVTGMLTVLAARRRLQARVTPGRARLLSGDGRRSTERRVQWASPVASLV